MSKYREQYRVESLRLKEWDYSETGYYFVTFCTKNKQHLLGNINNNTCEINNSGKIIENEIKITEIINPNVKIDIFQIMPNHVHLILFIDRIPGCIKKISLSTVIGQIKSISAKKIKKILNIEFSWQQGFYEHIIRNENALEKIRNYIINNPLKWELDKYFKNESNRKE